MGSKSVWERENQSVKKIFIPVDYPIQLMMISLVNPGVPGEEGHKHSKS